MFYIGEFSRLCRVTVRALRHYEKIKLLVPEIIDYSTGYRYYSVMQLLTECRDRLSAMIILFMRIVGKWVCGCKNNNLNMYFCQNKMLVTKPCMLTVKY